MKSLIIIAMIIPPGCNRFKRLGKDIADDVLIDLVYCPISKRLNRKKRFMTPQNTQPDEVAEVLAKRNEIYTSAAVAQCQDQDLKVMKITIPNPEEKQIEK